MQGPWVPSLLRELRPHTPRSDWTRATTNAPVLQSPQATTRKIPQAAPENQHSQKTKSNFTSVSTSSVQFSCSVVSNSLWPHEPSTPGLPVHHQLSEFTQTHVHWVGDAIQPSHPLSSPSPPALNLFQHQGLFKWVSSSHQLAKVLEFQLQHQSFKWTPRNVQTNF